MVAANRMGQIRMLCPVLQAPAVLGGRFRAVKAPGAGSIKTTQIMESREGRDKQLLLLHYPTMALG